MTHQQDWYTADLMERLRALRLSMGLTRAQLAEACHVPEQTVTAWEHSSCPTITLRQLADYTAACGVVPFNITYSTARREKSR